MTNDFDCYLVDINTDKISNTAYVDCIWDAEGIWVDLNYSCNEEDGFIQDYQTCFAELYDSGNPDDEMWDLALRLAEYMKNKYGIPLDVWRDDS